MYLSLLKLTRAQSKQLKWTDSYSLHRIVYDCFEKQREDMQESSGILHVELAGTPLEKKVLILSAQAPQASFDCSMQTKEISPLFLQHPAYQFELTINPVKRDSKTRKLIPLRTREEIKEWFINKAPQWGFHVNADQVEVKDLWVDRFNKSSSKTMTLCKAKLLGTITIDDQPLFQQSYIQGFGKAKSFGCGLLLLKAIS